MKRQTFGSEGEYIVHDYLIGQGYTILAMNYRRPTGEIDVIAGKDGAVAFIEVKRRTSDLWGRPAEAVTPRKRRCIVRTALLFLQERGLMDARARFDIIELSRGEINHIEDAFDATDISW